MSDLFQVNEAISNVVNEYVDYDTGEISDEGFNLLTAIERDRDQCALELAAEHNNHQAAIDGLDATIKRLKERKDRHQARRTAIQRVLQKFLPEGTKLESSEAKIAWRKSTATIVDDQTRLPDSCLTYRPPASNLAAVKLALQAGELPGGVAHFEDRNTLKVS